MNIWQLVIVLVTTIKLGSSLYKDAKADKMNSAGIVGALVYYSIAMFIYWKAGVLIL